jgi:hypothetical protein
MKRHLVKTLTIFAVFFLLLGSKHAQAAGQNTAAVTFNMTVAESLTLSASPNTITVNPASLTMGQNNNQAPITLTATWSLNQNRSQVSIFAWVGSATFLSAGGSANIPTSNVAISGGSCAALSPFTATGTDTMGNTFSAQCTIGTQKGFAFTAITPANAAGSASYTATVGIWGQASFLPGVYTGVVNFAAVAN